MTLQEQLDKAEAKRDKAENELDKAQVAFTNIRTQAWADWHAANDEMERLKKLIEGEKE